MREVGLFEPVHQDLSEKREKIKPWRIEGGVYAAMKIYEVEILYII